MSYKVIGPAPSRGDGRRVMVLCDCGAERDIRAKDVGRIKSCGCLNQSPEAIARRIAARRANLGGETRASRRKLAADAPCPQCLERKRNVFRAWVWDNREPIENDPDGPMTEWEVLEVMHAPCDHRVPVMVRQDEDETLDDVGNRYGVSRERVRQIEEAALLKLRKPSNAKRLRDFFTMPDNVQWKTRAGE